MKKYFLLYLIISFSLSSSYAQYFRETEITSKDGVRISAPESRLLIDEHGFFYILALGKGLYRWDGFDLKDVKYGNPKIQNSTLPAFQMEIDKKGNIYIESFSLTSVEDKSFITAIKNERIVNTKFTELLSKDSILAPEFRHIDLNNNIWFYTSKFNALCKFEDSTAKLYAYQFRDSYSNISYASSLQKLGDNPYKINGQICEIKNDIFYFDHFGLNIYKFNYKTTNFELFVVLPIKTERNKENNIHTLIKDNYLIYNLGHQLYQLNIDNKEIKIVLDANKNIEVGI